MQLRYIIQVNNKSPLTRNLCITTHPAQKREASTINYIINTRLTEKKQISNHILIFETDSKLLIFMKMNN